MRFYLKGVRVEQRVLLLLLCNCVHVWGGNREREGETEREREWEHAHVVFNTAECDALVKLNLFQSHCLSHMVFCEWRSKTTVTLQSFLGFRSCRDVPDDYTGSPHGDQLTVGPVNPQHTVYRMCNNQNMGIERAFTVYNLQNGFGRVFSGCKESCCFQDSAVAVGCSVALQRDVLGGSILYYSVVYFKATLVDFGDSSPLMCYRHVSFLSKWHST